MIEFQHIYTVQDCILLSKNRSRNFLISEKINVWVCWFFTGIGKSGIISLKLVMKIFEF